MFENLRGKKLLYLGGIKRAAYVVERARELGIYVVVADYNDDSPAKLVANEGVLIDATDVDALTEYCKKNKIDGIMTGYVDILLPVCAEVAKRVGLPCYMTDEMIAMSINKKEFKKQSNRFDVSVPTTFSEETYEEGIENTFSYPVFIKPVDSSGSRGASLCERKEEFKEKYAFAQSFSRSKRVIVEQFLTGTEFTLDYVLVDGKATLLSLADRYSVSERPAAVNHSNLMILPSKNLARYYEEVDEKVRSMFSSLGFKNGIIFLQGRADNKFGFYEMECRLGGTWPYIDQYYTGINPLDMLFSHALTGKMVDESVSFSADFKGKAAVIYFLSKKNEGSIAHIKGLESVKEMPYVVCVMQYFKEGDSLNVKNQTDILLLAVHLVGKDMDELKANVKSVYSAIDYIDELGESVLAPVFDVDTIDE